MLIIVDNNEKYDDNEIIFIELEERFLEDFKIFTNNEGWDIIASGENTLTWHQKRIRDFSVYCLIVTADREKLGEEFVIKDGNKYFNLHEYSFKYSREFIEHALDKQKIFLEKVLSDISFDKLKKATLNKLFGKKRNV